MQRKLNYHKCHATNSLFKILIFELIKIFGETKAKIRFIIYFYFSFKYIFQIYPNKELINFI